MTAAYLLIQLKRMLKLLPAVILSTILLLASLGILLTVMIPEQDSGELKKKINIGLVGNAEDSYLGVGLGVLNNMDSSRFSINFIRMEEKEAREKLKAGEIGGYIEVDDDFIEALGRGENIPLTYVSMGESGSLGDMIISEIAGVASSALVNSEKAVYAMQEYIIYENEGERLSELTDKLNLKLLGVTLNRNRIYDTELYGIYERLSPQVYYTSGMIVLFIMLWGINGSLLLTKKDIYLKRIINVRGCGAASQIAGEYISFLIMMYAAVSAVILAAAVFLKVSGTDIRSYGFEAEIETLIPAVLPVVFMLAAMQLALYETVSGIITSAMASFLLALGLGYISGCFYPAGFFPEAVKNTAAVLPAGIAMKYIQSCITGSAGIGAASMWMYTALFTGTAVLIRRRSLRKY